MIIEINYERKVHRVGSYYANIARCTDHTISKIVFPVALHPKSGHGPHVLEVSRLHTTTHHSV